MVCITIHIIVKKTRLNQQSMVGAMNKENVGMINYYKWKTNKNIGSYKVKFGLWIDIWF